MKNFNLLLTFLSLSILSSCSGGSSGGGSGITTPQTPISNVGTSVLSQMTPNKIYAPLNDVCLKESNSSYYKESFSYANNEFLHMREYHNDSLCSSVQFYASRVMTYVSHSLVQDFQVENVSLIDFQLSITDQLLLAVYNQNSLYGFNDWILSNAKSIIDRKLQPTDLSNKFITGTITTYSLKMVGSTLFVNGVQYQ